MSRVLVVEDEAHLAQGLRFNLQAEGHVVEVAGDGETALERLVEKRERFDAVVLDVMLPGKSGFDVAALLREKKNYVPILMLTARGRPEDVLQGFAAGADDYLAKPFELAILIARLESLLRRSVWMKDGGAAGAGDDGWTSGSVAAIRSVLATSRLISANWNCARWEIQSI
jgi:DNA-binding response OmpR family regulator